MKPPRHTTHVRLDTEFEGTKRFALQPIKDMDCLRGSPGRVTYLQQLHGKDKYKELAAFDFDGAWPLVTEEQLQNKDNKNNGRVHSKG